ncbi:MAG: thioredoxin family protein [Bacteroidota bacterium]
MAHTDLALLNRIHRDGLSYDAFRDGWAAALTQPLKGLSKEARKYHFYRKYNAERTVHVHEAYVPSEALRRTLAQIDAPQTWLVLTEAWCGDSSFNLPVIAEAAALADQVSLRILLRDENVDLIERYHTNGSHSIPKLIAFDAEGAELFTWGPRPVEAQAQVRSILDSGVAPALAKQQFADWTTDNEAWTLVDRDLAALVAATTSVSTTASVAA